MTIQRGKMEFWKCCGSPHTAFRRWETGEEETRLGGLGRIREEHEWARGIFGLLAVVENKSLNIMTPYVHDENLH